MQNAEEVIDHVKSLTANWKHYAKSAGVSKTSSQLIENTLKSLYD